MLPRREGSHATSFLGKLSTLNSKDGTFSHVSQHWAKGQSKNVITPEFPSVPAPCIAQPLSLQRFHASAKGAPQFCEPPGPYKLSGSGASTSPTNCIHVDSKPITKLAGSRAAPGRPLLIMASRVASASDVTNVPSVSQAHF